MDNSVEYFVEDDDIESDEENPSKIIGPSYLVENELENYEFDLILPEPNPLIKRAKINNEPFKIVYDFPFKKLAKFEGYDKVEITSTMDDLVHEYNMKKALPPEHQHPPIEYSKLESYFRDKEKLVYVRSHKSLAIDSFNNNFFNMKKLYKSKCISTKSEPNKKKIFLEEQKSRNLMNLKFEDYYFQPKNINDKTLVFESKFESGNLSLASKVSDNEYNLLLQNDVNTNGYIQWFFFEANNTTKGMTIKFNILNFVKSDSIFNHGMKVLIYSRKEYQAKKIGWFRGGEKISYYQNNILRESKDSNTIKTYRTLSFEYRFPHTDDQVYFAYAYPYTYTDLNEYLNKLEDDVDISKIIVRAPLCRTIAGNLCEVLTISNHYKPENTHQKRCIILISRVHPGETVSSYTLKGVIDFLTSQKEEANALRENFIFKIIPMINPDGVIHGNYRCDLAGSDLNRRWRKPSNLLYPTIYAARRLIENLKAKYKIALFCDFHGHSRKFNTFLYTCSKANNPFQSREFPYIMSRACSSFSYRDCSFVVHPYKKKTARVTLFEEFNALASFCLETSFFGPKKTKKHFTREDLEEIGHKFCESLVIFFAVNPKNPYLNQKLKKKDDDAVLSSKKDIPLVDTLPEKQLKRAYLEELYANEENFTFGMDEKVYESDSESSDDCLAKVQYKKYIPIFNQKKSKKSKKNKDQQSNGGNNKKIQKILMKKKEYQAPDNFKGSTISKETQESICDKIPCTKINSIPNSGHRVRSSNQSQNLTTNLSMNMMIDSEYIDKSFADKISTGLNGTPKSNTIINLNQSLSSKFDKLPNITGQDQSAIQTYLQQIDPKNNKKIFEKVPIQTRIKKKPIHNRSDYFHSQNWMDMNSNDIDSNNKNKLESQDLAIPKPIIKKEKVTIVKEAIIPKDFMVDFKKIHISMTPYLSSYARRNLRMLSLKRQCIDGNNDLREYKDRSRKGSMGSNVINSNKNILDDIESKYPKLEESMKICKLEDPELINISNNNNNNNSCESRLYGPYIFSKKSKDSTKTSLPKFQVFTVKHLADISIKELDEGTILLTPDKHRNDIQNIEYSMVLVDKTADTNNICMNNANSNNSNNNNAHNNDMENHIEKTKINKIFPKISNNLKNTGNNSGLVVNDFRNDAKSKFFHQGL